MDIKSILNKIEECKKDAQKKELLKVFKYQMTQPKNKKVNEQLLKLNFEKTLNKLIQYKEFDIFMEIVVSIIENLSPLSETYRHKYQEMILNLIIPKEIEGEEKIKDNLNYFLIMTNNLDDIQNIKYKKYLIYYLFFQILLKLNLDNKIIDLFIKLEKYMTKQQNEIIIYVFILNSFIYKRLDFPEQMVLLKKIIDFCKFDSSDKNTFLNRNYDLMKNIVIMLLLYTPFKQEILINLYNIDSNYFMNIIHEIIVKFNNNFNEDDINTINSKNNDTDLINIKNFFDEEIGEIDFEDIKINDNNICSYFNKKENFIKKYNKFIEKMNLKNILIKNKLEIFKGIIWTLSSIILKNYYIYSNNKNNDIIFDENKNHCTRLFNSLISLFQFIDTQNQNCFVKQYLELVKSLIKDEYIFEEWSYLLEILLQCVKIIISKKESAEKEFKLEINILNEIFNIILIRYNKNKLLFCDIEKLSIILHKCNHFLQKDCLLCFYIDIYLTHDHKNKKSILKSNCNNNIYNNFINNLETLSFNIFAFPPNIFSKTKNYLLEIMRVNYSHDDKIEEVNHINNENFKMTKQSIIESAIEKYLENIFISLGNTEKNYSFFNYILTEILCKTRNINFLNRILTLLIFNNNDKINRVLYNSFVSSIILNLFENLINNSSKCVLVKEKLSYLIDFFFDENYINDENIFKLGLSVLKSFLVNDNFELIFVKNINMINNTDYNKHSILVVDYFYFQIFGKKIIFNDDKEFITYHKNYYLPYILFPNVKVFKSINQNLENNITKTYIFENILEFYYLCFSKNIIYIKNVNLNMFFKTIFEEKDLMKISLSKKITHYLIKILYCLPYQFNNDNIFNNSSENISLLLKNKSHLNDEIQLNIEIKYKIAIINFLINFWRNLNVMISTSLNKIFNNEQLSQTIFNNKQEINLEEKSAKTILHNLLNKGISHPWCGELNLYDQFEYLYECIKLLKFYLISCSNEFTNQQNSNMNSNINNNDKTNRKTNRNNTIFSSLKNIIQKIIMEIFKSMNFKYFNKKYSYFIISLLYEIKELLVQFISEEVILEIRNMYKKSFSYYNIREQYDKVMDLNNQIGLNEKGTKGINIIYKAIFISLFLSWNHEEKIIDIFDRFLGTKYKSNILFKDKFIALEKFYDQKKNFDEGLQELIEHLSDIFNLYLMEYVPDNKITIMINILDEIFHEHTTYREYYFYKMAEWSLKIRKSREGININYKNIFDINFLNNINNNYTNDEYIGQKILKNSFVFYGNNSLIVINPIDVDKCSFSLRNPICNMNLIFDTDVPIVNNTNNNKEESLMNEDEEEEDDYENNEKIDVEKDGSSFCLSSESNDSKNDNLFVNEKDKNNKIFQFEEGTEVVTRKIRRKNSEDYSNMNSLNFVINNKSDRKKSKEFDYKLNNSNNSIVEPIRRKRSNTDFGDKYRKSILLAEKKKKVKNCLKLFSILTELTDFKIEQYKWYDITKNNNLYNLTKFTQNLDLLPLYFIHNCALLYHSQNSDINENNMAEYLCFIQKLGMLYNYDDIYPNLFNLNKNIQNNNNKDIDRYIVINQDSLTRINFNILNLTEKDKNKLINENDIIFIWLDKFEEYLIPNQYCFQNKVKLFFIVTRISDRLYKIQRKYNTFKKGEINYIIDELFLNEFIIDIESQTAIQILINMIKSIDLLIKIYNKNIDIKQTKIDFMEKNSENNEYIENEHKARTNSIILDNQNILISDDYMNTVGESGNNFDIRAKYIDENELKDQIDSPFKIRYQLMGKL